MYIIRYLINKLKYSGLYYIINEIRCVILGNYNKLMFLLDDDDKIKIISQNEDINLYEGYTFNLLYEDSLKEDFNVLYLHTKSITRYGAIDYYKYFNWIKSLSYYNIDMYKINLKYLNKYDMTGVYIVKRILYNGNIQSFYNGNFWWSKSEYIKKLGYCDINNALLINFRENNAKYIVEDWFSIVEGNFISFNQNDTFYNTFLNNLIYTNLIIYNGIYNKIKYVYLYNNFNKIFKKII